VGVLVLLQPILALVVVVVIVVVVNVVIIDGGGVIVAYLATTAPLVPIVRLVVASLLHYWVYLGTYIGTYLLVTGSPTTCDTSRFVESVPMTADIRFVESVERSQN
jgi:hypothetical protein